MQAFTYHMQQDFQKPDADIIAEGEDDERNFRNIHRDKEIKTYSKKRNEFFANQYEAVQESEQRKSNATIVKHTGWWEKMGVWVVSNMWQLFLAIAAAVCAGYFLHRVFHIG